MNDGHMNDDGHGNAVTVGGDNDDAAAAGNCVAVRKAGSIMAQC